MADTKITALADAGGATAADYLYIVDGATSKHVQFDDFESSLAHDNLSGFVANEHIDWTGATDNFSTTGTIHSDGNITTGGTVDGQDITGMAGFVTSNSAHRGDATGADHSDIVTAVGLNTAKDTNVSTNITIVEAPTNVDVQSSDGSNDTIAAANVTNAGVMTKAMYDNYVLNNAKNTNVDTDLSVTKNATTMTVVSSDGDNAVLVEADTTNAGILGSDKWDEIVANSTKTTYVKTNVKGHIAHGSTAATARPSGFTSVEWVGSVEPTNASNGDTWIDTT